MKLYPMSDSDLKIWAPRSQAAYAEDKMRANGLSRDEAEELAKSDFERLLPAGLASADNFLFSAKDEMQNTIGYIWYCVRGTQANRRAFICDVIVEEAYRGLGFGRQMMQLLELHVLEQGLSRIGLHVFGFNQTAIGLYKSLGYGVTDLVMEKDLEIRP